MSPRQLITATPYALSAETADDAASLGGHSASYFSSTTHDHTLDSLDNVTLTASQNGQVLTYQDGEWVNAPVEGAEGGDITGVTAGTGLSGGGQSGGVTLNVATEAITSAMIDNGTIQSGDIGAGQVVKSLNGLEDAVTLAGGTNITVAPSGNTLTISADVDDDDWSTNGSNIYRNTGNVGIGTSSPSQKLHVGGDTYISGNLGVRRSNPQAELHVDEDIRISAAGSFQDFARLSMGQDNTTNWVTLKYGEDVILPHHDWFGLYSDAIGGLAVFYTLIDDGIMVFPNGHSTFRGSSTPASLIRVDHPDAPSTRYLQHAAVGSSEMKNVYDGVITLDSRGEATVTLPDYIETLNDTFRYQLTCIGGHAPVYIAEEVGNGSFDIAGGRAGLKVSWQITGVRRDPYAQQNSFEVESSKTEAEFGLYQNPELYGFGADKGLAPAHQQ